MACYPGFDTDIFPGVSAMQTWWINSPYYWVGFYLAPAPCHSDTSWMAHRSELVSQGWSVFPIYVGQQVPGSSPCSSTNLTEAQGVADAKNAAQLASQAGFPSDTIIYLDVELGGTLPSDMITYIDAWVGELAYHTPYKPGVYCSYESASQIEFSTLTPMSIWVYHLTVPCGEGFSDCPTGSGYKYASVWQQNQQCTETYGNVSLTIDQDVSSYL